MKSQEKGAAAEYLATAALILNGYEVHLNVAFYGLSDLIAIKNQIIYKVQVKAFYDKVKTGKYRKGEIYRVAEMRTSNMANGLYHQSYNGLVDLLAIVDTQTGEVFLVNSNKYKSQVHKSMILDCKIFPFEHTDFDM